jgi:hypothetical protein
MNSGLQVVFSDLSSLGFMIPTGFVPVFLKILGFPMLRPKITGFLYPEAIFFANNFPEPSQKIRPFLRDLCHILGQFIHQFRLIHQVFVLIDPSQLVD